MMLQFSVIFALVALAPWALAHPGEKHDHRDALRAANVRHAIADRNFEALSNCDNGPAVQERKERAMKRRMETFHKLREERGINSESPFLHRRDNTQFAKWSGISHDQTGHLDFTTSTPNAEIFGANSTCILTPDNIIGPYYVLGEQIRSNIVENLPGIPLHLEIQFVDVTTCKPTPAPLFIDIWQCNAAGVYSGVSAGGQGGLKTTFLRGVQPTDGEGVVEFDTIFPGHYQGRATHQHITVHVGAKALPNNTYTGGTVSHISQIFFDEALITAVEATAAYKGNRVARTSNKADMLTGYAATAAYDPFPEYVLLDAKDVTKGVFMWLEIGFNASVNYDQYAGAAAIVGPDGGVANPGGPGSDPRQGPGINPPPTHG